MVKRHSKQRVLLMNGLGNQSPVIDAEQAALTRQRRKAADDADWAAKNPTRAQRRRMERSLR